MSEAGSAISAIEKLRISQGPLAGEKIRLAGFQRQFIEGALADRVSVGVWSIGRGDAKTAMAAALGVTHALGMWGTQPQRDVVIAARTKEQAGIGFQFARSYIESLDPELITFDKVTTRTHPHFSMTLHAPDGPHEIRAISADGKSALGGGSTLVILDERAAWRGGCIVGLDLGGAASMTASAYFWPETGRLEVLGWFPSNPDLLARRHNDHVGDRYSMMAQRQELRAIGDQTAPLRRWIAETMAELDAPPLCVVANRFKQAEVGEALDAEGVGAPVIWRGMGWRDGGEDVRRFQRAVIDGRIATPESLLMRSALADCAIRLDEARNGKLDKVRSTGRIDPVAAAMLAVAEDARWGARPPTSETFRII